MSIKQDLIQLIKPYYWINILLSVSYITAKRFPLFCALIFQQSDCELNGRETEILFFLMIVVMIRTRKAGSVTMINYLTSAFIYTKIANLILWFYADVRLGLIYGIIFVLCGLLLPEPAYSGPENIVYFRGVQNLEEELNRKKDVVWLVTFYTAWHPACVNFAPIFAQLSAEYSLENLKFGKIDVGRYPDAAAKFGILDTAKSRQLPSLLMFKEGKLQVRRPDADSRNMLQKFFFSYENIKITYDLPGLYKDRKAMLSKKAEVTSKSTKGKKDD